MEPLKRRLINVFILAKAAGIKSDAVKKLLILRVIEPDEFLRIGTREQPVFYAERLPDLVSQIKQYQSSLVVA